MKKINILVAGAWFVAVFGAGRLVERMARLNLTPTAPMTNTRTAARLTTHQPVSGAPSVEPHRSPPAKVERKTKANARFRSLTLGTAVKIPFPNIEAFVGSLQQHTANHTVVLFCLPSEHAQFSSLWPQVHWEKAPQSAMHPSNARYTYYFAWLQQHLLTYDYVQLADVRDIIFQGNPILPPSQSHVLPLNGVDVFLEEPGRKLNSGDFNTKWIRDCFGEPMLRRIGHHTVSCSGYVRGQTAAVARYLRQMVHEIAICPRESNGIDQGVHNVLVRTKADSLGIRVFPNGGDVWTLGYVDKTKVKARGAQTRPLGHVSAPKVLHQVDRHRTLDALVAEYGRRTSPIVFYVNNGCNGQWRRTMGFTGECVQHESIVGAFHHLGIQLVEKETVPSPSALCDEAKLTRAPMLIVGSGHSVARKFVSAPCRLRIGLLDWFGTAPSMIVPGVSTLSVMPVVGSNTFWGYGLTLPTVPTREGGAPYGVVLGKALKDVDILSVIQGVRLKCTSCRYVGVEAVGMLPRSDWFDLLRQARFLLGLGDPVGSPSVIEAISLGCVVILPRARPARTIMGRRHSSQYDDLHRLIGDQPSLRAYVCWYTSTEDLTLCVASARSLPTITVEAFTQHAFESRVRRWVLQSSVT
jgi:hypothetical protein